MKNLEQPGEKKSTHLSNRLGVCNNETYQYPNFIMKQEETQWEHMYALSAAHTATRGNLLEASVKNAVAKKKTIRRISHGNQVSFR